MFVVSTSGKPMPEYLSEDHVLSLHITADTLHYALYRERKESALSGPAVQEAVQGDAQTDSRTGGQIEGQGAAGAAPGAASEAAASLQSGAQPAAEGQGVAAAAGSDGAGAEEGDVSASLSAASEAGSAAAAAAAAETAETGATVPATAAAPAASSSVAGESIDASLSGRVFELESERTLTLEQFRRRMSFQDFSFFGYNIRSEDIVPLNFTRYRPLEKFSSTALREGCPVRFLFPDTESTFLDALIVVVARYRDGVLRLFCNLEPELRYEDNNAKNALGDLPLVRMFLPRLSFSGPTDIAPGGTQKLTLRFEQGSRNLESLCEFHLRAEEGYLPRRLVRLGSGESAEIDVVALGLAEGDTMTVSCALSGVENLASHTLNVHSSEV